MVLETRAEMVTRLRSAEVLPLCGLAFEVEPSEEVLAARGVFVPSSDISEGDFMDEELVEGSAPFSVAPPAEGEEG